MRKSTIITVLAFVLGIVLLAGGFILFTDNNISAKIFATTTTTAAPEELVEPYDPINYFEVDINQYVTLGEYKNLKVKVEQTEVGEEFVNKQIDDLLIYNEKIQKVTSGTIEEGVIFSFDYTGYLDGVAFEDGADEDSLAYIEDGVFYLVSGSQFIDGFAEGIINHKVGDKFSIDVKFPDNYGTADLAGKDTVFEIKINYIAKAAKLTDAIASEISGGTYKTVADFRAYVFEYFNDSIKSSNEDAALKQAMDNAQYRIPEEEKTYYYDSLMTEIETYAAMYQMTADMFLMYGGAEYFLGMNIYSLAELDAYVDDYLKEEILVIAIIEAEGLEVTDEEYNLFLDSLVAQTGSTKEALIEQYTEEYIKQIILSNEAYAIIWDSAKYVTE